MKNRTILGLLALFVTACGTSHQEATTFFADSGAIPYGFPAGTSFSIVSAQKSDPFIEKQIAAKIASILQKRGYTITQDAPDYQLLFDYKVTSESVIVKNAGYSAPKKEKKTTWEKDKDGKLACKTSTRSSIEWNSDPKEETRYKREVSICVLDGKEKVWSGSSTTTNTKDTSHPVPDHLLLSVLDQFGRNSGKNRTAHISYKSAAIPAH